MNAERGERVRYIRIDQLWMDRRNYGWSGADAILMVILPLNAIKTYIVNVHQAVTVVCSVVIAKVG